MTEVSVPGDEFAPFVDRAGLRHAPEFELDRRSALLLAAAVVAAVLPWLFVIAVGGFFLFDPTLADNVLGRRGTAALTAAWVVVAVGPAVALARMAADRPNAVDWLPVPALVWFAAVMATQIFVSRTSDWWYVDHLAQRPVYLVVEVLVPLASVWAWDRLRDRP